MIQSRANVCFKVVSRAFQILSDPDKKKRYDQFGGDPDNRFSSSGASSPFAGFSRGAGGGRGPMFEDEISPEELFRQFFGGGGGGFGGPFGGGAFGGEQQHSVKTRRLILLQGHSAAVYSTWAWEGRALYSTWAGPAFAYTNSAALEYNDGRRVHAVMQSSRSRALASQRYRLSCPSSSYSSSRFSPLSFPNSPATQPTPSPAATCRAFRRRRRARHTHSIICLKTCKYRTMSIRKMYRNTTTSNGRTWTSTQRGSRSIGYAPHAMPSTTRRNN